MSSASPLALLRLYLRACVCVLYASVHVGARVFVCTSSLDCVRMQRVSAGMSACACVSCGMGKIEGYYCHLLSHKRLSSSTCSHGVTAQMGRSDAHAILSKRFVTLSFWIV